MNNRDKVDAIAGRLREEQLYEQVAEELLRGEKRNGLWLKAIDQAEGAEDKAKALYTRLRVQSIKDEVAMAAHVAAEDARRNEARSRATREAEHAEEAIRRIREEERRRSEAKRQAARVRAESQGCLRAAIGAVSAFLMVMLLSSAFFNKTLWQVAVAVLFGVLMVVCFRGPLASKRRAPEAERAGP